MSISSSPVIRLLDRDSRAEGAVAVAAKYGAERIVIFLRTGTADQFQPGPGFAELPHDASRYALLERALDTGPQFDPNGRRAVIPLSDGSVVEFSGTARPVEVSPHDVDLLVAVAALLRNELEAISSDGPENRQVREVLESITDAFFLLDAQWHFTYANRRALEVLMRSRENLIGRHIWEEFPGAAGTRFQSEYERAMDTRTTVEFEEYYPAPLDSWYSVKVYPALSGGLSVYFADIGERRRLEDVIRSVSTPILDIGDRVLVVPLIGAFDAERAGQLSDQLLQAIRLYRARVAVVDVTGLALVDVDLVSRLRTTLRGANLLGCETITVGVSSDIARELVHTDHNPEMLRTCLDLKHGIELAQYLLTGSAAVRAD